MVSFVPAAADADLAEGRALAVKLQDWPIALCRSDGEVRAVLDRCSHQRSPLSSGRVRHGMVVCPLHGARYELSSGRCVNAGYAPVQTFEVAIVDGIIHVDLPSEPFHDMSLPAQR